MEISIIAYQYVPDGGHLRRYAWEGPQKTSSEQVYSTVEMLMMIFNSLVAILASMKFNWILMLISDWAFPDSLKEKTTRTRMRTMTSVRLCTGSIGGLRMKKQIWSQNWFMIFYWLVQKLPRIQKWWWFMCNSWSGAGWSWASKIVRFREALPGAWAGTGNVDFGDSSPDVMLILMTFISLQYCCYLIDVSTAGCAERQYKQDLLFPVRRKIFDPWEGIRLTHTALRCQNCQM